MFFVVAAMVIGGSVSGWAQSGNDTSGATPGKRSGSPVTGTGTPIQTPFKGRSWIDYWRAMVAHSRDQEPDPATMVKRLTEKPIKPRPEGGPLGGETFTPYFSGADTSLGFVSYLLFGGFERNSDCTLSQVSAELISTSYQYQLVQTVPGYEKYLHKISGLTTTVDKFPDGCKDPNTVGQEQQVVSAGKTKNGDFIGIGFNVNGTSSINVQTMSPALSIVSSVNYTVGFNVGGVLVADFNGDGYLDIAVVDTADSNYADGQISVLISNGDGTFKTPVQIACDGGAYGLVAADFNGDGKVDLVATSVKTNGDYELVFFAGQGNGTFKAPVSTDTGKTEKLVNYPVDINKDGKVDIIGWDVVPNGSTAPMLDAMLNNGSAVFTSTLSVSGATAYSPVAVGDLNADGKLDVVFGNGENNAITVLKGDGTGKFTEQGFFPSVYASDAVYITDFDGDGNQDILVGIASEGFFGPVAAGGGMAEVLLGKGDFTFSTPAAQLPQVSGTKLFYGQSSFAVGDLNGDGKADVAVMGEASGGGQTVETFINPGNGTGLTAGSAVNFGTKIDQFTSGQVLVTPLSGTSPNDLVVSGAPASGSGGVIQAAINSGTGTFTVKSTMLTLPEPVTGMGAGDFNADGKGDLAFVVSDGNGGSSNGLYTALGNGDGTFKTPVVLDATVIYGGQVYVADVNNDGKPDIVVAGDGSTGFSPSTVSVYLNTGTTGGAASFAAPKTFATPDGAFISGLMIADLNGDGKQDIGIVGFVEEQFVTNFYLYAGNNTATFTLGSTTNLGEQGAQSGVAADVNQDGLVDIIVDGCCGLATPSVLLGSGKGEFYPPQPFLSPQSVSGIKTISLTGTKYPDLIMDVASNLFGSATILPVVNHYANASSVTKAVTVVTVQNPGTLSQGDYINSLVTVAEKSAAGQPTGTVTAEIGSTVLQTVQLGSGQTYLNIPTTGIEPGTYTLTVNYSGDNFNEPSTGTTTLKVVYYTAMTFTVSPNPVPFGDAVTLKATVTRGSGSGTPTGSVEFFYDGGNALLANVKLVNGVATLVASTKGYPPGTYVLQAGYYGDANDGDVLSQLINVVLVPKGKDGTTTAVTLNPAQITQGQTATVTAQVTKAAGSGTPTGTAAFTISGEGLNNESLGTVKIDASGKATVGAPTTSLYAGYTYTIQAVYSGDSTFYTSSQTVPFYLRTPSYVNLSAQPTSVTEGQTVTLTAVVPQESFNPVTGKMTFEVSGQALATVTLVNGSATFSASTAGINPGSYGVTAVYSGDAYNGGATSPVVTVTVTK